MTTVPIGTAQDAQADVDNAIHRQFNWQAELYFTDLENFDNQAIDLFQFTDKNHYHFRRQSSKSKSTEELPHLVIFDRKKYPPNDDGIKRLCTALKIEGIKSGTNLVYRSQAHVLSCFRCRKHGPRRSKVIPSTNIPDQPNGSPMDNNDTAQPDNILSDKTFDNDGVRLGIRPYRYHRDRSMNRCGGKSSVRGTSTMRPVHAEETCKVALRLGVKEGPDGYIYLKQGCGHRLHSFHPKPQKGDLCFAKRHISDSTYKLITSGAKVSVGNGSLRCIVLENQSELISRGSIQRIRMEPDFLTNNEQRESTASQMVHWLRKHAADPNVGLCYCFLSCRQSRYPGYHRHPKGRPGQTGRIPLDKVEENMEYVDTLENTYRTAQSVEQSQELPLDNDALNQTLNMAREIHNDSLIDLESHRILLGAGWVDAQAFAQFQRFPEVLFIDSTHKTNNEARPLLMICGRDQSGKAFVVARIFMPNETSAFYRWVFLKCLPCLLGEANLKRVKLVITDGDAQEFEAVEESCLHYLTNAFRGRCMYHIVQKTFERTIPNSITCSPHGLFVLQAIRTWIYTWGDGSSCSSEIQFSLSKDLLLKKIESDELCHSISPEGLALLGKWLVEKILPNENTFAFWRKRFHRCFDEYMNNSGEAMNRSCKHSDVSTRPNMSMASSANAMFTHSSLSAKDRRCAALRQMVATPLFIKEGSCHNVDILQKLSNMARHMLIQQYSQRNKYTVLRHSEKVWYILRNSVSPSSEFKTRTVAGMAPPSFKTAWRMELNSQDILCCECGYKQRNGIPCRHLFCVEDAYDLSDISVRWQMGYSYYAFVSEYPSITESYLRGHDSDHEGIRMKTDTFY